MCNIQDTIFLKNWTNFTSFKTSRTFDLNTVSQRIWVQFQKKRKRKGSVVEARGKKKRGAGWHYDFAPYFVQQKKQNFKHGSNNCSVIQEEHGDVLKPNDLSILLLFLHISSENFPSPPTHTFNQLLSIPKRET